MKSKKLMTTCIMLTSLVLLSGCSTEINDQKEVVVVPTPEAIIPEKVIEPVVNKDEIIAIGDEDFIEEMDRIYIEASSYEGRRMTYEGFVAEIGENEEGAQYTVARFFDIDHEDHNHTILVGMNSIYEGKWPAVDTWVRVEGTIELQDVGGEPYPILRVETLETLPTRGQEKVKN